MMTNSSREIDFKHSGETAVSTLLSSGQDMFPVKLKRILRNLRISLLDYNQLNEEFNVVITETSRDGGVIWREDTNEYVIIYNRESYKPRMIWTIAHELGHILLNHHQNIRNMTYDDMEIEANHFASELLAPYSIIKVLSNFGNTINEDFLKSTFGLSHLAAEKRISTLNKFSSQYIDESMSFAYQNFIRNNMKRDAINSLDYYELDLAMESERDKWR